MQSRRAKGSRSGLRAALCAALAALVTLGFGATGASCSKGDAGTESGSGCVSTREFFEQQVWSAFMGTLCTKCHTPDGTAVVDSHAKLVLQPSSYPGFIDADLAALTTIAQMQNNGTSELLLKPLGELNHGGGAVLMAGSPEYKALQSLVTQLAAPVTCADSSGSPLDVITLADAPSTLRMAALDLAGRLPTAAEVAAVQKGGDTALDTALDGLMKEDAFYVRLREIFNDTLLTDKGLEYNGAAIDFTDAALYPAIAPYKDATNPKYTAPERPLINQAIAREPLDLIAYIVKNGKPYTDVVSGTYTVVNPYSAIVYGLDKKIKFTDPTSYDEFHEAQVIETGAMGPITIPHAGVLSTPSFLSRWTTSPTNINRGRARRVFAFFLATDILKIAVRPIDPTAVTAIEDPTRNSTVCTVCHQIIDPVAGGFRGYDDYDYESFDPSRPWHDEVFAPGFGPTLMDPSYYTKALQWLGPQVAADPRFAISAVRTVYTGMTGHIPLDYPADSTDPDFTNLLAAWQAQDGFFTQTATAFSGANFDLKVVFKAMVKSPYYRAVSAPSGTDAALLADVGAGRLLTPEMLDRKITAITGYGWRYPWDYANTHEWLIQTYDILYGGIDSDTVTTRLTSPNGIIGAVGFRFANETSCALTGFDFTKDQASRKFFQHVDVAEVPESAGHAVDGSVADIKANIQALHKYLLNEDLSVDDPEITRTYQLFLDTWHELNDAGDASLPWECQGRIDPSTGVDLPKASQITSDPSFTIRSWMAVLSYLLSDYKFLYE